MFIKELYNIVNSQGMEYIKNPETRSQIIKITFMVLMKLISMIRNRVSKHKEDDNHIECNCNSCKVWRAKLDDALKKEYFKKENNNENKSFVSSSSNKPKRKIISSIFNLLFNRKNNEN